VQVGGGTWVPDPDHAVPFAEGGAPPSVAWDATRGRWLLAYAAPLATEISVRSGLGPNGPWSLPVPLGRCALPREDPGPFCTDLVVYPWLPRAPGEDEILLAQQVGRLDRPGDARDAAYGTRLVSAGWPPSLP
jgi:hypothetical protein